MSNQSFWQKKVSDRNLLIIQVAVIIIFSFIPLLFKFPFRINIFLAWEGAYRLSIGQTPYRDFGLPLGFGFWIIPALFFKLFGSQLFTLVICQCFINLVSLFCFRSILRLFDVSAIKILFSVIIFCISFVFINFWPWYNHTVFVFELLGIFLLLKSILTPNKRHTVWLVIGAAFFIALSLFTKQDGGGLAVITSGTLLLYDAIARRSPIRLIQFVALLVVFCTLFILPFLKYDFLYWFNYGQEPHYSRLSIHDILNEVFRFSSWIKFYMLITMLIVISKFRSFQDFFQNQKTGLFTVLTICILFQALIVQVTSYIPHNVNIYFHSFAIAYFLSTIQLNITLEKIGNMVMIITLIFFWWSADYWLYGERLLNKVLPPNTEELSQSNTVSKSTWTSEESNTDAATVFSKWVEAPFKTFSRIYLPEETIDGINRLKRMEVFTDSKDLIVLNMSELTPLAAELDYEPILNHPLWSHQNVSIFDKEIEQICTNIQNNYYDIILFQTIPNLNNFYPDRIRQCLIENWQLKDRFLAPRRLGNSYVEVYTKKKFSNNE